VNDKNLTLRSGRRPRLEGWATSRLVPPFETALRASSG
jgi:hypothetical protein